MQVVRPTVPREDRTAVLDAACSRLTAKVGSSLAAEAAPERAPKPDR